MNGQIGDASPDPRAVRRWINRLVQLFALLEPEHEEGDYHRASHLMICPACDVTMLCSGERVKL
jgi:hypothetical protein